MESTSKTYSLKDGLRLFERTVTPTLLYGSVAWVSTKETESKIKRAQRRMLRMVIGAPRRGIIQNNEAHNNTDGNENSPTRSDKNKESIADLIHISDDSIVIAEVVGDDATSDSNDDAQSNISQEDKAAYENDDRHYHSDELEPWQDWIQRIIRHGRHICAI